MVMYGMVWYGMVWYVCMYVCMFVYVCILGTLIKQDKWEEVHDKAGSSSGGWAEAC